MDELVAPASLPERCRPRGRQRDPQDLVVQTVAQHSEALLRVARRYTGCAADAEDAYQRTLEIFVRNAHRLDPATAHRWVFTVCKNEALEVRRQRAKLVGVEAAEELDRLDDGREQLTTEERSERFEELMRAAEALGRLKPQEVTALVLKAQGLSYAEIAERQGWTYTKVNRCLTEGRRSFLRRYAGIEAGEECSRWSSVLSALADGEASAAQLADARPHLRNCPSCRAMLADLHRGTAQAAALLPVGILAGAAPGGGAAAGGLLARLGELLLGAQERIAAPALKAQASMEAASASKLAAVAASAAALAGSGVAVERHAGERPARAASPSTEVALRAKPAADRDVHPAPPVVTSVRAADETPPEDARPAVRPRRRESHDARPGNTEFTPEAQPAPGPVAPPPPSPAPTAPSPPPATASSAPPVESGGGTGEFGFEGN